MKKSYVAWLTGWAGWVVDENGECLVGTPTGDDDDDDDGGPGGGVVGAVVKMAAAAGWALGLHLSFIVCVCARLRVSTLYDGVWCELCKV